MKIKNNNGSAMIIVILAMALFMLAIPLFSSQSNNQIKSTKKHYENIEAKYLAESGIEKTIADICDTIESSFSTIKSSRYEINNTNSTIKINSFLSQVQSNLDDAKKYIKNNDHGNIIKSLLEDAQDSIELIKHNGISTSSIIENILNIREKINLIDQSKHSNNIDDSVKFNNEINLSRTNIYYALNSVHELNIYHDGHNPVNLDKNDILLISNQVVSPNIYSGNKALNDIYNDFFNLSLGNGGLPKFENELYKDIDKIRGDIWSQLGSGSESLISKLGDYVESEKISDREDNIYKTKTKEISDYIDSQVKKLIDIQVKLDQMYVSKGNYTDNLKNKIKEIQTKIESNKYYLYEVKCKLGICGDSNPSIDENLPTSLTINPYKFPNESKYTIEGYERIGLNIPININYNSSGIVESIDPTTINIQSTGYKDNKPYKVKAEVTFNISTQGEVSSYNINKWEKDYS